MDNNQTSTPPSLDEIFRDMHAASSQAAPQQYGTYAARLRSLVPTGTRLLTPLLIAIAVAVVFSGVGVFVVRNLDSVPAAPMSAAGAFQSVQAAPAARTVRVGYAGATNVGRAVTPAQEAIVYEWEITSDGQQRFWYQGTYYCTDKEHSIESLWLFSHDIETKDDTFREMYLCRQ